MTSPSQPSKDLVPASGNLPSTSAEVLPDIIRRADNAAIFAAEEFFFGKLRNPHTRAAYLHAVKRFLAWCDRFNLELHQITPKLVGQYLDELRQQETSISTRKQHLAALRHFFDEQVMRNAVILNPAASVRGERYQVVEGKTPEITVDGARKLLASIDIGHVVGLRDRAIIAFSSTLPRAPAPWPSSSEEAFIMPATSACFTSMKRAARAARSRCATIWSRLFSNTSMRPACGTPATRLPYSVAPCERKNS